ncbi:programmed cell death protein 2 [Suillus paluster]|uniref:programmed cell death protein 2 n=1 Tax=Suillus paluster TaxID=48578 RepID=UPI001B884B4A|nr:programmed cell death protein 2 [Suillus paluster]KAG1746752.1 programmed cell death protein 2 [Suillus paluster]
MPSAVEDDWSDSDDEISSEVETAVLLGIPDGTVEKETDIQDAAVSRIGGHPAMLPSREPSFSCSQCKNCSYPMELLVQVWCPFEDSPMDRALYIWGCSRSACQRKDGSLRAWRALRYNVEYAAKLAKKLAKKQVQQKTLQPVKAAPTTNPFSMQAAFTPSLFGLGDQVFGQPASAIEDEPEDTSDTESVTSESSEHSSIIAVVSATIDDSPWRAAPSFPPIYLSTISEYLPPQPKTKIPQSAHIDDLADDDSKGGKDVSWAFEPYENSLEVDSVFDRFTKRVSNTGEQCLRYELKGIPLPFSSDKVFDRLFPVPAQDPLPVTKAAFKVVPAVRRSYSTASIPSCPVCKTARVFECQLMPNLINVLRISIKDDDAQELTDAQRMNAVRDVLQKKTASDKRGMEWGTCMIFSCEKDCCLDDHDSDREAKECWREEFVLVQWDD